ncbi:MAG: hypothetical protein ACREOZ_03500, partial [Gloeomargaritales cyanobacterium]
VTRLGSSGSVLYCVWGASANSVWAGGGVDSGDVVHYINGQFQYYKTGMYGVYSINGTSDSDIWFGGGGAMSHWNGNSFALYVFNGDSLPNMQQSFGAIWIAPDNEIFAVGGGGAIVHRKPDYTWEVMQSGTTLDLTSMRGFSSNNIYAVGNDPNCSGCTGIILHYNGNAWQTVAMGKLPPPTDTTILVGDFKGIGGAMEDSLYVVGERIYIHHSSRWTLANAPCNERNQPSCGAYVEGVAGTSWNNVWIVGDFGWMMHFDGDHWEKDYQFFNLSSSLVFNNVLAFPNDVFSVGWDNNTAYFIHGQ